MKEELAVGKVTNKELYDALIYARGKYKFVVANGKRFRVQPEEDPLIWKQV